MIADLDRIVEPLRATCTTKVKANSVKQEFEKQDELKRSAMRAVAALLHIADAGENERLILYVSFAANKVNNISKFVHLKYNSLFMFSIVDKSPLMNEFLSQIKSNPELSAMFESIQKDATTTASETSLMDIS